MRRNSLKELVKKNNGGKELKVILAEAVQTNGSVEKAAQDLGIRGQTLRAWMVDEEISIQRQTTVIA